MPASGTTSHFYAPNVWCLMWNGWSPKHLNLLKSCAGLTSKLSLSTKAVRWSRRARGIEVTSTVSSKTCRIYGRVHSHCLPCRCAASNMFWTFSESLRALHRDAICPRYSQHAGDADNERHVEFGTVMGAVCNQGRVLGADPIGCRRS